MSCRREADSSLRRFAFDACRFCVGFRRVPELFWEGMATFVLVHSAWHGAWCWRRVARLLARNRYEVFTPPMSRRMLKKAERRCSP
jgi:hypothetical protein